MACHHIGNPIYCWMMHLSKFHNLHNLTLKMTLNVNALHFSIKYIVLVMISFSVTKIYFNTEVHFVLTFDL